MAKHILLSLLAMGLIATLVACSSSPTPASQASDVQATATPQPVWATPAPTESGIKVDEGLFDVTITLPPSLFENQDMSRFDQAEYSREQGFSKAIVNEDGSVSVTMSRSRHNEIMSEMKASVDKSLQEMVQAENTPYIEAITSTDGYRTITVDVDKAGYEAAFLDLTPMAIGLPVMLYQQFSGTNMHCEIIIRDASSGAALKRVTYPDALNRQ